MFSLCWTKGTEILGVREPRADLLFSGMKNMCAKFEHTAPSVRVNARSARQTSLLRPCQPVAFLVYWRRPRAPSKPSCALIHWLSRRIGRQGGREVNLVKQRKSRSAQRITRPAAEPSTVLKLVLLTNLCTSRRTTVTHGPFVQRTPHQEVEL